ncbi:MAG: imidazolonepropionase [Lachnospiraceae bacterium]|nr:imidazolonepropionase [Lachnospiraceae bacterium]
MSKLLITNIGLLATPLGRSALAGKAQGEILKLSHAWIMTEDGVITEAGSGEPPIMEQERCFETIDAGGRLVTPGLVDAHTHLIFGGFRQHELADKLRGRTYLEILAAGGGILSTVKATRAASEAQLTAKALAALKEMLSFGVTLCEAKSGYGLSTEEELKQLRVVRNLNGTQPVELVSTFLGAHAIPPEYKDDHEGYVRLICEDMLPAVAAQGLAEYCDVFCESGVFSVEESRRILSRALALGLKVKIHADEIDALGGAQLAGALGAVSAEHLIAVTDKGIKSMQKGGTIACLLPATSFYLGVDYAPARKFIQAGVPVALATDYNPGSCPSLNLQLVMNLACLKDKMTPEEVLTAVTLNGAAAIGRAESHGSIEAGKKADFVIWNAADLDYLCYRFGSNLAGTVIKGGIIC